jgi:4-hydroxybutyrate dehydrogenase
MELIKVSTKIHKYDGFKEFADTFEIGERDLILTHGFLYEPFMKPLGLDARVIIQETYGSGEPSDEMMNAILADAKGAPFDRIFAIGGGTVLDIAKILVLKDLDNVVDAFEKTIPLIKEKELIAVPTTCGTGSEVTNITIAEIKSKQTKMGLAVDELLPDHAALIPGLLKGLPYKFYIYSSIDALIHAIESYVSPKANAYTRLFSVKAIEMILDIYLNIIDQGEDYRFKRLEDMAIASNYAGIAFGNAGVGAVHALSYPLGGKYHVPHGEANYQFFTEVFKLYTKKNPEGAIKEINERMAYLLDSKPEEVYEAIEGLLNELLGKNKLRTYGMLEEEKESFTDSVIEGQGRLLANNYVPLSRQEILGVYTSLY